MFDTLTNVMLYAADAKCRQHAHVEAIAYAIQMQSCMHGEVTCTNESPHSPKTKKKKKLNLHGSNNHACAYSQQHSASHEKVATEKAENNKK